MRKILIIIALTALCCGCGSTSRATKTQPTRLRVGQSRSIVWNSQLPELLRQSVDVGIEYTELTMNAYFKLPMSRAELDASVEKTRQALRDAGMKVWSLHLPFSSKLDISVLDDALRAQSIAFQTEMIEIAASFHPQVVVLHPSAEPIPDAEREQRMINSIASIDCLRKVAAKYNIRLCIENLPRTCLGRDAAEIKRLIGQFDDVDVCFDTNHLLTQSQQEFIEAVGDRIRTLHVSDYDRVDERHWAPFEGVIDWDATYAALRRVGYDGVFMYEARSTRKAGGSNYTPADFKAIYDKIHQNYIR